MTRPPSATWRAAAAARSRTARSRAVGSHSAEARRRAPPPPTASARRGRAAAASHTSGNKKVQRSASLPTRSRGRRARRAPSTPPSPPATQRPAHAGGQRQRRRGADGERAEDARPRRLVGIGRVDERLARAVHRRSPGAGPSERSVQPGEALPSHATPCAGSTSPYPARHLAAPPPPARGRARAAARSTSAQTRHEERSPRATARRRAPKAGFASGRQRLAQPRAPTSAPSAGAYALDAPPAASAPHDAAKSTRRAQRPRSAAARLPRQRRERQRRQRRRRRR